MLLMISWQFWGCWGSCKGEKKRALKHADLRAGDPVRSPGPCHQVPWPGFPLLAPVPIWGKASLAVHTQPSPVQRCSGISTHSMSSQLMTDGTWCINTPAPSPLTSSLSSQHEEASVTLSHNFLPKKSLLASFPPSLPWHFLGGHYSQPARFVGSMCIVRTSLGSKIFRKKNVSVLNMCKFFFIIIP